MQKSGIAIAYAIELTSWSSVADAESSLIQVMTWHQGHRAKPLPEAMLTCSELHFFFSR